MVKIWREKGAAKAKNTICVEHGSRMGRHTFFFCELLAFCSDQPSEASYMIKSLTHDGLTYHLSEQFVLVTCLPNKWATLLQFTLNMWKRKILKGKPKLIISFKTGSIMDLWVSFFYSWISSKLSISRETHCNPSCTVTFRPSQHVIASIVHTSRHRSYQRARAAWKAS